jgi:hypothetical protein
MGATVSLISKPKVTGKNRSNSVQAKSDEHVLSPGSSNAKLEAHDRTSPRSNVSPGNSPFGSNNISPSTTNRSPMARLYSSDHLQNPHHAVSTPYRDASSHPSSSSSSSHNHPPHQHLHSPLYDRPLISPRSAEEDDGPLDGNGNGLEEEDVSESPSHAEAREAFAQTAMSLGFDGVDDLIFNMMYFSDEGDTGTFGQLLNTMQQETLALHSEQNTPYRLHPADEAALAGLLREEYETGAKGCEENECLVCRDEIENGSLVLRIPACRHYFHEECLLKWVHLVS